MAKLKKDLIKLEKDSFVSTNISNELIEAFVKKNNLTALKILFYLARADGNIPNMELITIRLQKEDICEYCNIKPKTLVSNLRKMQETTLSITDDEAESFMSVLPKVKIPYGSNIIEIKIFREVLALIWNTKNKWTSINTKRLMSLSSKHSIRMILLLEMIDNFHKTIDDPIYVDSKDEPMKLRIELPKVKNYSLEELNALFGTNYKRLGHFEQSILIPVKEELDKNSKLSLNWDINYDKKSTDKGRSKAIGIRLYALKNNVIISEKESTKID